MIIPQNHGELIKNHTGAVHHWLARSDGLAMLEVGASTLGKGDVASILEGSLRHHSKDFFIIVSFQERTDSFLLHMVRAAHALRALRTCRLFKGLRVLLRLGDCCVVVDTLPDHLATDNWFMLNCVIHCGY